MRECSECVKILLVADPQILGEKYENYFGSWIARWDSDRAIQIICILLHRYLEKTFSRALKFSQPHVIAFLGDLMDEGHIANAEDFERYKRRLDSIFSMPDDIMVFYFNYIIFFSPLKVNRLTRTMPEAPKDAFLNDYAERNTTNVILSHIPLLFTPGSFVQNIKKDDTNVAISLLARVSGIGPAKAKELVEAGIKTLEDLKKHQDKLTHHQKLGLKYFDDFEKKIPRAEIVQIEKILKNAIKELNSAYLVTICGSYRRNKEESGDIDVLVTHPNYISKAKDEKKKAISLKIIVECLEKKKLITDTISLGSTKFMGVCQLPEDKSKPFRRLDIRLTFHDQYYCAILYFTGSDLFNKNMRAHALEKKYTLNEYALKRLTIEGRPGEAEKITSEKDVFKFLGLPYKDPKDRNI
ncbi:DNA polymerase beta [Trachymyrmex zeteki]|uniref:DNA polymerase n=1 Tax=Mycetomoellerius zeteki TaxID=64791 RepID=A0A151WXB2_9HYME|nr:DNA polymerase beta [Trachymyrmex zeteki]